MKSPAQCVIAGEAFLFEEDEGLVYLRHPHWSLMGCGRTRAEALADLHEEMLQLRPIVSSWTRDRCTERAWLMRRFVLDATK